MTAVARSQTLDKRYYGVVEGLVVDVKDPDKEGRVKVRMPFFDDETVTEWCRVRQLYAGNGYGTFFIPEVGDEVLIAFVHGDLRLPVIIGGLYNGKDKPPSHRTDEKDQKVVRTKAGHQITMDDTRGERRVIVETAGGHTLDLNDKERATTIKTSGGHEVRLDDQGAKIVVKTSGSESITFEVAGSKVTLKSSVVVLDAPQVKLGGIGAVSPVVLGDVFTGIFNGHTHPTAVGPSGPPIPLMTGAELSKVTSTK